MKKAIILVSGGVDSTTVMSIMKKDGYEIYAMSFKYGQRHSVELEKVKESVKIFGVKEHKIIEIDLTTFGGSALTDVNIDVPEYNEDDLPTNIPVTYVPARNTIFLSYALAYSEVIKADDIFLGVHYTDHANYPDCRLEYIKSYEHMANLATSRVESGARLKIHAPLIDKEKAEIVAIGLRNAVDYSKTISCYNPTDDGISCGKCLSCTVRLDAFAKNNKKDPIKYL